MPCKQVDLLAVELLQNEVTEKLPSEAENLQTAISRLQTALNKAYQYVDDVVVSLNVALHVCCLLMLLTLWLVCACALCAGHCQTINK